MAKKKRSKSTATWKQRLLYVVIWLFCGLFAHMAFVGMKYGELNEKITECAEHVGWITFGGGQASLLMEHVNIGTNLQAKRYTAISMLFNTIGGPVALGFESIYTGMFHYGFKWSLDVDSLRELQLKLGETAKKKTEEEIQEHDKYTKHSLYDFNTERKII